MSARVLACGSWQPDVDLLAPGPPADPRWRRAPDPVRPAAVPAGSWRRMSRLARAMAAVATPLLVDRPDREQIPLVWGTALGELVPTGRFLRSMILDGPDRASPLAFQSSVYNAPPGLLSMALGLQGPAETVVGGGATGLLALARGLDLLVLGRAPAVLVVAGDDLNEVVEQSMDLLDDQGPVGEAVAAVLLGSEQPGQDGALISVIDGLDPGPGPVLARQLALPGEIAPQPVAGALHLEDSLGRVPAGGLAAVVALARAITQGRIEAGSVIDQDQGRALTARLAAPSR